MYILFFIMNILSSNALVKRFQSLKCGENILYIIFMVYPIGRKSYIKEISSTSPHFLKLFCMKRKSGRFVVTTKIMFWLYLNANISKRMKNEKQIGINKEMVVK